MTTIQDLAAALRARLSRVSTFMVFESPDDCGVLDVEAREEDVLITFTWMKYPHTLAYAMRPEDGYGDTGDTSDWADGAIVHLDEELGTGLVTRASRRPLGDRIELTGPDWPNDRRFYVDWIGPRDREAWSPDALRFFEEDGFDTGSVRRLLEAGKLIGWHRLYANNKHGSPYLGHGAVIQDGDRYVLEFCEVRDGVPDMAALDLCHGLIHAASWAGATEVHTHITNPDLNVLGFEQTEAGQVVDTTFLNIDLSAARKVRKRQHRWRTPKPPKGRTFRVYTE
jgi:hypothetical protein